MYKKLNIGRFTFGLWTDRRDRRIDCGRVLFHRAIKWWLALGPIHLYVEAAALAQQANKEGK